MRLTSEQQDIVNSQSKSLGVFAFAGAGKTSTLVEYAKARPNKKMLYLAFNKAIQEEAARKFPINVRCITTHALAYAAVGFKYRHKLSTNIKANQLAIAAGVNAGDIIALIEVKRGFKLFEKFLASRAMSIDDYLEIEKSRVEQHTIRYANLIWKKMIDINDRSIPMLHDGYLKLYQLTNPVLDYECILFDESQDANPVTLAIVENQSSTKIYVGDPHQQIYTFRGAVNAMYTANIVDKLYLTQSFRFGENIASIANSILSIKKEDKQLIGARNDFKKGKTAYISRGNAALYFKAVLCIENNQPFAVIGGIESLQLDVLIDIWNLWADKRDCIKSKFIASFKEYDLLVEYATHVEERDLLTWISLIDRHKMPDQIPQEILRIEQLIQDEVGNDGVILTTAHKSKGLEFYSVQLADDFPEAAVIMEPDVKQRDERYPGSWDYGPHNYPDLWIDQKFRPVYILSAEEINIRYVASTRAEYSISSLLWGNPPFMKMGAFAHAFPNFLHCESVEDLNARFRRKIDQVYEGEDPLLSKIYYRMQYYRLTSLYPKPEKIQSAINVATRNDSSLDWLRVAKYIEDEYCRVDDLALFVYQLHLHIGLNSFRKSVVDFMSSARVIEKAR